VNAFVRGLRGFGAFWWDFIVGDDWLVAAGVVLGLSLAAFLTHEGVPAWWVLPAALVLTLPLSLWRAVRQSGRD
jgi:hypothetical protein